MFYLIPLSYYAYLYRFTIAEFLLRQYTKVEMSYNRWYKLKYPSTGYKLFINGHEVSNDDLVKKWSSSEIGENRIYEIEYVYKNKHYRIGGKQLDQLLDYVENVDEKVAMADTSKTFKWIAAVDDEGNCHLDLIKKLAGPTGDFYKHAEIDIHPNEISWLKNKKLTITDFRLDEYIIDENDHIKV
jgi:hypothetical protein